MFSDPAARLTCPSEVYNEKHGSYIALCKSLPVCVCPPGQNIVNNGAAALQNAYDICSFFYRGLADLIQTGPYSGGPTWLSEWIYAPAATGSGGWLTGWLAGWLPL